MFVMLCVRLCFWCKATVFESTIQRKTKQHNQWIGWFLVPTQKASYFWDTPHMQLGPRYAWYACISSQSYRLLNCGLVVAAKLHSSRMLWVLFSWGAFNPPARTEEAARWDVLECFGWVKSSELVKTSSKALGSPIRYKSLVLGSGTNS